MAGNGRGISESRADVEDPQSEDTFKEGLGTVDSLIEEVTQIPRKSWNFAAGVESRRISCPIEHRIWESCWSRGPCATGSRFPAICSHVILVIGGRFQSEIIPAEKPASYLEKDCWSAEWRGIWRGRPWKRKSEGNFTHFDQGEDLDCTAEEKRRTQSKNTECALELLDQTEILEILLSLQQNNSSTNVNNCFINSRSFDWWPS